MLPNLPRLLATAPRARSRSRKLAVELLDDRIVPAIADVATPPHFYITPGGPSATPYGSSAVTGYTPQQLRSAYGVDQIHFGSVAGNGAGTTIAIIVAFDNPGFKETTDPGFTDSDLHQFDLATGLPDPPSLKIVDQTGASNRPAPALLDNPTARSWAGELALDIEWAHSFAPGANILVVEAFDDSGANLLAAANYARSVPGVNVVSMSLGSAESSVDLSQNATYTTPAGHGGVTFLAATGDDSAPGGYPAYAPTVIAVGGTELTFDNFGTVATETGWFGGGGGISQFETRPTFQANVLPQDGNHRLIPDISLNASPDTGAAVYDSFDNGSLTPWAAVGGTSLATPSMAGIIAIADQGRALNFRSSLDGATQILPALYSPAGTAWVRDITFGINGFVSGVGYDLVTGLGVPKAPELVAGLVALPGDVGPKPVQPPPTPVPGQIFGSPTVFVGSDFGSAPLVRLINLATGATVFQTFAFDVRFAGGVRVARGDVNGDGTPDLIMAAGPGGGPHVEVLDGKTLAPLGGPLSSFFAFNSQFTGGVFVASADVNHDGFADIVTAAGSGGGPRVRVFSGKDGSVLRDFFAYTPTFTGGVSVAAGDFDGDGFADIITGAGPGGAPHVKVFSGANQSLLRSFLAYSATFTGGVWVAAADVTGDKRADVITGAGPGGGPHVRVFSNVATNSVLSFMAFAPSAASAVSSQRQYAGGVRVFAEDVTGDGQADIIALTGPGIAPRGYVFDGSTGKQITTFVPFDPSQIGGVFVG